jgi:hypothetical protein
LLIEWLTLQPIKEEVVGFRVDEDVETEVMVKEALDVEEAAEGEIVVAEEEEVARKRRKPGFQSLSLVVL